MHSAVLGSPQLPAALPRPGATNHPPRMDRRLLIVATVIGLHVAGLWALQTGLLQRAVELVVPVTVIADLIEPPQPQVTPEPTPPKPVPMPAKPLAPAPRVAQAPAPMPLAVADPTPALQAPTGVVAPPPVAPVASVVAEAALPKPAPAPARVSNELQDTFQLPPKPAYPSMSNRLREQGSVYLDVKVEADGNVSDVSLVRSSGFLRLDEAALKAALRWHLIPKNGGNPQPGHYQYLVRFELRFDEN